MARGYIKYTDAYFEHVMQSYDMSMKIMENDKLIDSENQTKEYKEKIQLAIFEDMLRRFDGNAWE
jgi:hypothetical protein